MSPFLKEVSTFYIVRYLLANWYNRKYFGQNVQLNRLNEPLIGNYYQNEQNAIIFR